MTEQLTKVAGEPVGRHLAQTRSHPGAEHSRVAGHRNSRTGDAPATMPEACQPLPASRWLLPPAAPSGRPRRPGCWAARSGLSPCGRRRVLSTSRRG